MHIDPHILNMRTYHIGSHIAQSEKARWRSHSSTLACACACASSASLAEGARPTSAPAWIYTCVCACMCVCVCLGMCFCLCICFCLCMWMYYYFGAPLAVCASTWGSSTVCASTLCLGVLNTVLTHTVSDLSSYPCLCQIMRIIITNFRHLQGQ